MAQTLTVWFLLCAASKVAVGQTNFLVGRGIADVTGLLADGALFGYANPDQDARGNHLRQFSRAFVIADTQNQRRVAIVAVDITLVSQSVVQGVTERLTSKGLGGFYNHRNIMLTPNHSHSFPGGYNTYWIYQVPSNGFINETYEIMIEGVAESIRLAHNDLRPGNILVNHGDLLDANINRSPSAYENNPQSERDSYQDSVDKEMTVLKFITEQAQNLGVFSLFPTHTTSMKNTNHLVSGDNKGYAAYLMEREHNPGRFPGQGDFVAGFAQTNEGDATPNIDGARCTDTGLPCDYYRSTCPPDDEVDKCVGKGPTDNMFEDTRIIGDRQYLKAKELFDAASTRLSGPVDFRHQWVNMSAVRVTVDDVEYQLCRPSLGYSFAAGATDGPGTPPFFQGDTEGDPLIDAIRDIILPPSDEIMACQAPKPILFATGEADDEWPWQPEIVPIQIFRIGDIVLIAVPGEWSTMAGRRLRNTVRNTMIANGAPSSIKAIIVGISNTFTSYCVTTEEYQIQRYEGASTIFGQYTLNGYQQLFGELARALATGDSVPAGQPPPDLRDQPEDALGPTPTDLTPIDGSHGDTLVDANPSYARGAEVRVVFVAGNPRNNHTVDKRYLEVQRQNQSSWDTVYTDAHWETKFIWASDCHGVDEDDDPMCREEQTSNATIAWAIPAGQPVGTYRIVHVGYAKLESGQVSRYTAASRSFSVQ